MDIASTDTLLADAREGDRAALNKLIELHRSGVYRYGLRVCRTTEDAEDAVQETLWAATRAIRTFRGTATSVASWLFTIVRNECFRLIDRHRRSTIDVEDIESEWAADFPALDDAVAARLRAEVLADALSEIDPLYREVILLRDIEELSAPEAAERLGISVDALKSRLHRARVTLRDRVIRRSRARAPC